MLEQNDIFMHCSSQVTSPATNAGIAAAVCASQGVPVWLFSALVPTPFVAAAVGQLGCAAGVMVTASHNPAAYNGYKVCNPLQMPSCFCSLQASNV